MMKKVSSSLLIAGLLSFSSWSQITSITHEVIPMEEHEHNHDHTDPGHFDPDNHKDLLKGFDLAAAEAEFKEMNVHYNEHYGFIRHKKMEYLVATYPELFIRKDKGEDVIPLKSAGCPNVGFENLTFQPEWTGGTTTYTAGYTNTTIQSNGINAAYNDNQARHTILTTPPINNDPAMGAIVGYDPEAIDGATGKAVISFVAPNGNGASVRLGNRATGAQKERLRYQINVDSTTKAFYYQFAVVLQNPPSHDLNEQPFFSIKLYDGTGAQIGGPCGVYNVLSSEASTDTSFKQSAGSAPDVFYRDWDRVNVDLTPFIGQTITVEFETADCDLSGHFGYAYIDAGCLENIDAEAAFCPGDPYALLVASDGFAKYTWYGPNDSTAVITGETNDTLQVTNPQVDDTFYVDLETQNGCKITQRIIVKYSYVNIDELFTENTCFGASIGSASCVASGSITGYNYTWTPVGVTTTEPEIDSLPSGNYTLTVSSPNPNCGTDDTTFIIDFKPVFPPTVPVSFCEGVGEFSGPLSTSYQWYGPDSLPLDPPIGNQQHIIDSNAFEGKQYYLFYELDNGCGDTAIFQFFDRKVDSRFELSQPSDCRSLKVVFVDETENSDTITYSFTGPNTNIMYTDTTDSTFTHLNLSTGVYDILVEDEGCRYDTTYTITDLEDSTHFNFEFCPGDPYNFSSIAEGYHSWTDPTGNVILEGQFAGEVIVQDVVEGAYIDSCLVSPGCYSLWIYNMDSVGIEAEPLVQDLSCGGANDGVIAMVYVSGPPGFPRYTVESPNGYFAQSQSDTDTVFFDLAAGTYYIESKLFSCRDFDTVDVNEPDVSGDTLAIMTTICSSLDATTLYAPPGFSGYQWYKLGVPIPGAEEDSLEIGLPANFNEYHVLYYMPGIECKVKTSNVVTGGFSFGFEPDSISNVFTPNGDGSNDIYYPFSSAGWTPEMIDGLVEDYRMIIYNRWGNKMFETTDYLIGWDGTKADGTPANDGSYFVNIRFLPQCGTEEDLFEATEGFHLVR